MEYMTMIVRWCYSPNDHINFPRLSTGWYLSRWWTEDHAEHLTVICARLYNAERVRYTERLFSTIKKLWSPEMLLLVPRSLESVLTDDRLRVSPANDYSVTYSEIQPGVSFYNHIAEVTATVKEYKWVPRKELTVADDNIMFKLACRHVSIERIISDTV